MFEITPDTPFEDLPSFWVAEEAGEIAKSVIREHHNERLGQAPITYIFAKKMKYAGTAAAKGAKDRMVAEALGVECDFVITLNWSTWVVLSDEQKEALVDHELTHCVYKDSRSGDIAPAVRQHDLEEFREIVDRHGLWSPGVKAMARSMKRTTEPGEENDA